MNVKSKWTGNVFTAKSSAVQISLIIKLSRVWTSNQFSSSQKWSEFCAISTKSLLERAKRLKSNKLISSKANFWTIWNYVQRLLIVASVNGIWLASYNRRVYRQEQSFICTINCVTNHSIRFGIRGKIRSIRSGQIQQLYLVLKSYSYTSFWLTEYVKN